MDSSCVASAAASVLASTIQVTSFLYGSWDEAGAPSAGRLIHELSRLRNMLQETEEAALMVPVPVILYTLPEAFEDTAMLLQQLKVRLWTASSDSPPLRRQDNGPINWSWRPYDTTRKMRWGLTKTEVEAFLGGLQSSLSRLQQRSGVLDSLPQTQKQADRVHVAASVACQNFRIAEVS